MLAEIGIAIFAVLGLIHVYWAIGGGMGRSAAIPQLQGKPLFRPGRAATFAVAFALFAAAALLAIRAGFWPVPALAPLAAIGTWVLAGVFALRAIGDFRYVGFFKRITSSRFARLDSLIYSPLCAGISLLVAGVALS